MKKKKSIEMPAPVWYSPTQDALIKEMVDARIESHEVRRHTLKVLTDAANAINTSKRSLGLADRLLEAASQHVVCDTAGSLLTLRQAIGDYARARGVLK